MTAYRVNISRTVVEHSAITIDLADSADPDSRHEAARVWVFENLGLPIFENPWRAESQWEIEALTKKGSGAEVA